MTPESGVDWSGLLSWLHSLATPATLVELGVIAGCLGLSALPVSYTHLTLPTYREV